MNVFLSGNVAEIINAYKSFISKELGMFASNYRKIWNHSPLQFPAFSGTRIMMMPVKLGFSYGVPGHYIGLLHELYSVMERRFTGQIGYLTIDERELAHGETLRRGGLHVDGYYHGRCGAWEMEEGNSYCEVCDKEFILEEHVIIEYTTKKYEHETK